MGFYEIPILKETIDSLQVCDEIFYKKKRKIDSNII